MNKKFTQTSLLAGICIMLTLTGLGFIKTPLLSITIMHLPVIIGTLIIGKKQGIILGLIFGLCSLYQNLTIPTITSFVFYNPLVSVFPRIMIPISMIVFGKLIKSKHRTLILSMIGSLTNTILVLTMIYALYLNQYAAALNIAPNAVFGILLTTALTNGLAEAIIVGILSVYIARALKKDIMI